MSTQIIAVVINLLATLLPLIGVQVGTDQLTNTIQVLVAIGTGVWIWYKRTTLQEAPFGKGDVTALGARKY